MKNKKYSKCLIYKKRHGDKIEDEIKQQIVASPVSEMLLESPMTRQKVKWSEKGLVNHNETVFYFKIPIEESIHGKYFSTSFVQHLDQFIIPCYIQGQKLLNGDEI